MPHPNESTLLLHSAQSIALTPCLSDSFVMWGSWLGDLYKISLSLWSSRITLEQILWLCFSLK